jgi:hypothetical protein
MFCPSCTCTARRTEKSGGPGCRSSTSQHGVSRISSTTADLTRASATRCSGSRRHRHRAPPNICHRSRTKQSALLNDACALQISSFSLIAPLAVGLALSGCTTGQTPVASGEAPPPSAGVSIGQRDLAPEEKKVIMDAVAQSLRNPGSAKYHWAKFPAVVTEGSVNYCATVDAQSPYAAYNGRQAYIVEAQMSGNRVSSAVIGLMAGGKDFAIVTNMCAKYGLDPRNAS